MSIKNTIARIIRSDFKQMQGSSFVEERYLVMSFSLNSSFLKADLALGDQTKVLQPRDGTQCSSLQAMGS